jgi:hypothetical protein
VPARRTISPILSHVDEEHSESSALELLVEHREQPRGRGPPPRGPTAVIDYVREASERLGEQVPAGRQALAEKKTALVDVKARLARYHERFERAGTPGEGDFAWERIKELCQTEAQLKAEIAELEAQVPNGDRELDAVRARRYLRTLAHFFRSRPRYEESLYGALHQHHHFRVAVLAADLGEATLEFEGGIEPSEEDDSLS